MLHNPPAAATAGKISPPRLLSEARARDANWDPDDDADPMAAAEAAVEAAAADDETAARGQQLSPAAYQRGNSVALSLRRSHKHSPSFQAMVQMYMGRLKGWHARSVAIYGNTLCHARTPQVREGILVPRFFLTRPRPGRGGRRSQPHWGIRGRD